MILQRKLLSKSEWILFSPAKKLINDMKINSEILTSSLHEFGQNLGYWFILFYFADFCFSPKFSLMHQDIPFKRFNFKDFRLKFLGEKMS